MLVTGYIRYFIFTTLNLKQVLLEVGIIVFKDYIVSVLLVFFEFNDGIATHFQLLNYK